jgi:glycogen operon protein
MRQEGVQFHFILNAYWEPLDFELPKLENEQPWRRWIDTALDSPDDIVPWDTAPQVPGDSYRVQARSVAILYAPVGEKSKR